MMIAFHIDAILKFLDICFPPSSCKQLCITINIIYYIYIDLYKLYYLMMTLRYSFLHFFPLNTLKKGKVSPVMIKNTIFTMSGVSLKWRRNMSFSLYILLFRDYTKGRQWAPDMNEG